MCPLQHDLFCRLYLIYFTNRKNAFIACFFFCFVGLFGNNQSCSDTNCRWSQLQSWAVTKNLVSFTEWDNLVCHSFANGAFETGIFNFWSHVHIYKLLQKCIYVFFFYFLVCCRLFIFINLPTQLTFVLPHFNLEPLFI